MNELNHFLEIETAKLKHWLCFQDEQDFLYIPGSSPVCLVAHIDTLPRKKVHLVEKRGIITNKNGLLGADDRAGIFAALEIHRLAPLDCKPHILFTDYEETGGRGAKQAAQMPAPKNINLLIELDRKGCAEYVTYTKQPLKICKYIESFGFQQAYGSYSDIADIGPTWLIAAVNLSVGYYSQHTDQEFLVVDELEMTINRVSSMLLDPPEKAKMPKSEYCLTCGSTYRVKNNLCLDCREWNQLTKGKGY